MLLMVAITEVTHFESADVFTGMHSGPAKTIIGSEITWRRYTIMAAKKKAAKKPAAKKKAAKKK